MSPLEYRHLTKCQGKNHDFRVRGIDRRPKRRRKLNNVDPQAWLEDVLRRIADHLARRLHERGRH
jgi:hypothetical protein